MFYELNSNCARLWALIGLADFGNQHGKNDCVNNTDRTDVVLYSYNTITGR